MCEFMIKASVDRDCCSSVLVLWPAKPHDDEEQRWLSFASGLREPDAVTVDLGVFLPRLCKAKY